MYATNQPILTATRPPLAGAEFRTLQTRSAQDARVLARLAEDRASSFSLREWINHRLEWKMFPVNTRAVDAVHELNQTAKDQSGEAANGAWFPLQSLARDLNLSSASALVANGVSPTLQSSLTPFSAIMSGATILSGLTGSGFSLPVVDTPVDAGSAWVGDGSPGPNLTPTTRLSTLTPKTLVFSVRVSRRLMMQSSADMERVLRMELLKRTMDAIDQAGLAGAGPNAPAGLLNDAGLEVFSGGANGAAPSWASLVELEHAVGLRQGSLVNPAFLTSPAVRKKLRLTPRGPGLDYVLNGDVNQLMGQPLRTSSVVPVNLVKGSSGPNCSALIFGDLAEMVVGFWGPLAVDILVDGVTLAESGMIRLIVRCEVAVATRDIRKFAAYNDVLTA